MVRDPNMFTLFNMPLKKTALLKSGLHIDMFPSTVRMSTYLVAFIISDFQNITNYTNSGLKVRKISVSAICFLLPGMGLYSFPNVNGNPEEF